VADIRTDILEKMPLHLQIYWHRALSIDRNDPEFVVDTCFRRHLGCFW